MRTLLRDVFACLLAVVVLAGACSSAKKIASGEAYTLNSDCKSPLVCTMGKCHQGCRETGDCPAGQSCVVVGRRRRLSVAR